MKFSIETIVAATIAVVFVVLSLGAIVREQDATGRGSTDIRSVNQVAAVGFDTPSPMPLGKTVKSQLLAEN
ncbi:MAG: hypothetical protein ACM3KL_01660 [Alphaproteobacteria bacterium]